MSRPSASRLDLNRATLARNLLLDRERVPVVDALRRLVALQAQEPASPYVALWNRVTSAPPRPGLWRALRAIAPLVHAPTGGPWAFGRVASYVAAPDPAPAVDGAPRADVAREGGAAAVGGDAALRRLVLRYLAAFGPASRQDFAQFAMLRQTEVRPAFEALADELVVRPGPDGSTLYDVAGAPLPDGDTPAPPRLLGMWDSVLLAYADRSRVIPSAYRADVIRRNGDVLPTVLVDGFVAGVWRPVAGGIEVTAFHELSVEAWDAIEQEARALRQLLVERDPALYARFGHWWSRLPAAAGGLRLVPLGAEPGA